MTIKITRWRLLAAFAVLGIGCVYFLWSRRLPEKLQLVAPIISDLHEYKAKNGHYPENCEELPSYATLIERISIYTGVQNEGVVTWSPFEVSNHEFTILVDRDGYEIYAPTQRIKPISFSSFAAYRYDSTSGQWQNGRIHWSLLGTYWSKE